MYFLERWIASRLVKQSLRHPSLLGAFGDKYRCHQGNWLTITQNHPLNLDTSGPCLQGCKLPESAVQSKWHLALRKCRNADPNPFHSDISLSQKIDDAQISGHVHGRKNMPKNPVPKWTPQSKTSHLSHRLLIGVFAAWPGRYTQNSEKFLWKLVPPIWIDCSLGIVGFWWDHKLAIAMYP